PPIVGRFLVYLLVVLLLVLFFFFCSSLLPPPSPTLFPYTTLFRSAIRRDFPSQDVYDELERLVSLAKEEISQLLPLEEQLEKLIDRKSTRLNSSHVSISYAVFCLKKKNKQTSNMFSNII